MWQLMGRKFTMTQLTALLMLVAGRMGDGRFGFVEGGVKMPFTVFNGLLLFVCFIVF